MKRFATVLIAIASLSAAGIASAQSRYDDAYGDYQRDDTYTDYARVNRVDPVLDGRYRQISNYGSQRCYETTTAGRYDRDGYDSGDGYRNDGSRYDGYDAYGRPLAGTGTGRNLATIAGGVAGAVLGSQVGGGTGTYAATAIGSMVGGMAGRQIYEQNQRERYVRPGVVRVCEPVSADGRYDSYRSGAASAYDVTYVFNGRQFTRRMDHHPGDRIRVRVDVVPE
jgi:uncharacterized protein YcfJ